MAGDQGGDDAYHALPPTVHRILMATVRYLLQCQAPRDSGWTDLLARPLQMSLSLAQTVLAVPTDSDSIQLRSGDVNLADLDTPARVRQQPPEAQAGERTASQGVEETQPADQRY